MEQDQTSDQNNETADIAMHQIGSTKAQPVRQYVRSAKKHFAKTCGFEHQKQQEIEEITILEGTK